MASSSYMPYSPENTDYVDLLFAESLAHYSVQDTAEHRNQSLHTQSVLENQRAERGLSGATSALAAPCCQVNVSDDTLDGGRCSSRGSNTPLYQLDSRSPTSSASSKAGSVIESCASTRPSTNGLLPFINPQAMTAPTSSAEQLSKAMTCLDHLVFDMAIPSTSEKLLFESSTYAQEPDGYSAPSAYHALNESTSGSFTNRPEEWWQPTEHREVTDQERRPFDMETQRKDSADKCPKRERETPDGNSALPGSSGSSTSIQSKLSQYESQKAQRKVSENKYRSTMKDKFAELYNSIPGLRRLRVSALESDKPRLSRKEIIVEAIRYIEELELILERNSAGEEVGCMDQ